jgi:hypothetical protein
MQFSVLGQTLNGSDLRPFGLHREHAARFDRPAVDMDDARTTLAGIATDMGAREAQLLTEKIDKQCAVLGFGRNRLSVHRH